MKRKIISLLFLLMGIVLIGSNVSAASKKTYINLENSKLSTDGKKYSAITEYDDLDSFVKAYESNKLPDVYITNFLFDGVSSVKTPDLDDFIENDSNDTKIKALEIKVLNIVNTGNYELTGEVTGYMVAVNTNELKGNINIYLNNVNIDTDSKKAPALFIYNKETTYTDCIVTIKTIEGTKNYLEGGKLKKVSLVAKDSLDDYTSYYSGDSLTNYEKYTSYYGMFTKKELNNILFATVTADSEGLMDGDPYIYYKGSGAISSDIDLYFEGEGYLEVSSKNKEGIETKGNLTFSGGTGDYAIYAYDDCLNTTNDEEGARNTLTIDVNSLIAIVNDEGDEGDAIDSNGTLTINGGTIYAFAHSTSGDAGLDSGKGTYINGGTIIATGNMSDEISSDSKQKFIYASFNKVSKDTLITILDENEDVIVAFKTSKDITTLLYSSNELDYESYKIYTGGEIDGTETNGLYTKINSYTKGEELSYNEVKSMSFKKMTGQNNVILYMLIGEIAALIITVIVGIIIKPKKEIKEK